MLAAERHVVVEARDAGRAPSEVLAAALAAIDVEESLLDKQADLDGDGRGRVLAPRPRDGRCDHLRLAPEGERPADACEDCLVEGTTWVHLRTCLSCGHVACCDSSPRKHAQAHYRTTAHPVIVSSEPHEAWRWCWVDSELG
jgi:CPA1 family monovalent cation:H+ antiporter